jgi:hypothetical protein
MPSARVKLALKVSAAPTRISLSASSSGRGSEISFSMAKIGLSEKLSRRTGRNHSGKRVMTCGGTGPSKCSIVSKDRGVQSRLAVPVCLGRCCGFDSAGNHPRRGVRDMIIQIGAPLIEWLVKTNLVQPPE